MMMSPFKFRYTCCMHWHHRHRLIVRRPLDAFNSRVCFRLLRHFRCLPNKRFTPCASTNTVGRSLGIIDSVLQLIPVYSLFAQPTKMVWVTIHDKVPLSNQAVDHNVFHNDYTVCVAVISFSFRLQLLFIIRIIVVYLIVTLDHYLAHIH